MIQHTKTFIYGFIATLFCWSFIIIGGFTSWLAFEVGLQADGFDILIIFVGSAFGIAGIHGFYCFLVEEDLMKDYFGVLPKE
jgi:hypothetical protein